MTFSQSSHLSHPKYRPDIDGLRAIAIGSVVAFHAFPSYLSGGFIGVDIFFVISGYLISIILFNNLDKGTFSFREFYARRIKRIFPALILVLFACYVFGWFALLANEFKQLNLHIASSSIFIQNIVLWKESGYFDNLAETKPLLHMWSLCVEEQFYLVWPLLTWLTRKGKFNFLILTVIVLLMSFLWNLNEVSHDVIAAFFLPQTRFWELLCGSLLAWLILYKKEKLNFIISKLDFYLISSMPYKHSVQNNGKIVSNLFSFVGLILLIYGFFRINSNLSFPGKWAIIPTLGAVLIILAGTQAWFNRKVLSNNFFIWVGLISFPLYLWHWPLLSFARIIAGGEVIWTIRVAMVLISILFAWLTYKFIEKPMRMGEDSVFKVAILCMLLLGMGSIGYYSYKHKIMSPSAVKLLTLSKELGWQLPVGTQQQISLCRNMFPERNKMGATERDDNFCYLQKAGEPNVLMVGDSLNLSLFPGLSKYDDINLLVLSASAAAPFYNIRTTQSTDTIRLNNFQLTNQAIDYALTHDNIKVVIMSFFDGVAITHPEMGYKMTDITDPENQNTKDIFIKSARKTIKDLLASNKKIIYVLPNPGLVFDVGSCVNKFRPLRLRSEQQSYCMESAKQYYAQEHTYGEWVQLVLKDFPEVEVFDASKLFCDSNNCYAYKDGKILYRDVGHLSISGSNLVAPSLHSLIVKELNE